MRHEIDKWHTINIHEPAGPNVTHTVDVGLTSRQSSFTSDTSFVFSLRLCTLWDSVTHVIFRKFFAKNAQMFHLLCFTPPPSLPVGEAGTPNPTLANISTSAPYFFMIIWQFRQTINRTYFVCLVTQHVVAAIRAIHRTVVEMVTCLFIRTESDTHVSTVTNC